jgi:HSP20 family protein
MAEMNPTLSKERAEQSNPESTRGAHFAPRVDIFENEKELLLLADVPGARPEDVDLRFENGELLLHARVAQRRPARGVLATEYE